ncbi:MULTISPECIES: carbohydrate kinase family protein [unclassified Rhizobium]|jgi:ribokinase|uniref:carbohydrate kinase family protein n=1 Tax=unclassified Rhizobium TaxID=2613769 RepID=UPI000648B339|nr:MULTISPECIES: carbohydrate kinase family protein [unclassified Rhizobium]MBN8954371.1 carbohydrate kinase family protein [Rhizobium tropici]OJY79129.1 MAG: carbohydrate kinase family protein [Rhizobium sp. 60-20]RKD67873.1 ribokinase [Rhizobium sp. WW_1]
MAVIALLGDINIDLVLDIPVYPGEGGEAIATGQMVAIGGSATNTAIALARAGHECRLIGRVGQDAWGRQALSELKNAGVSTRWIGEDPAEPTQLNIVAVSTMGERTMFAYRGANAQLSADMIDQTALADAALLHLSGYAFLQPKQAGAALRAIDIAERRGIPITLDIPGGVVAALAEKLRPLLPKLDTILLADSDLPQLLDRPGNATLDSLVADLLERGVKRVAIKGHGTDSLLRQANASDRAPWFSVEVVDTVGAGDAFAAGHIHGRISGLSGAYCCRLANAFGAVAVTRKGAGQAMPSLDEVFSLMTATR